nr:protein arginine N-methyltransferase 1 [Ciona intestinalis]|eukprot:XP_002127404.1 protein arginine N-methyltransferase 1 [Ciona intestinalis]
MSNNNPLSASALEQSDDVPDLIDADSDKDWSDEEDCDDVGQNQVVNCIFTEKSFPSAKSYFLNLKSTQGFDIWNIVHLELSLDFFGYVKLINFLRSSYNGKAPPSIKELKENREIWDQEKYLKPVVEDDLLLQFMIDDEDDYENEDGSLHLDDSMLSNGGPKDDVTVLQKKLRISEEENKNLRMQLQEVSSRMNEMKSFMKGVIMKGDIYRPTSACRSQDGLEEEEFEDSGYFGTYSHHDIHAEMLQDTVRTKSYHDAIMLNSDRFKDKIVLDVGCGTGILSMFAAKAGAKHVYAVDMSEIAFQAMDIVRENDFNNKITVIKGCIEEVTLPVAKVDIIISEWMGYFLLYESMLDSVLFAAKKWLNNDGFVLPDRCDVHLVAAHDEKLLESQIGHWDNVYGFKMSCIKRSAVSEAFVQVVRPTATISDSVSVMNIALPNITQKQLNYKSDFVFKITKSGKLSFVVGYFDIFFSNGLDNNISFTTGPWTTATHWKQTVFFLNESLDVNVGDRIDGSIYCRKNPKDPRSLLVDWSIKGKTSTYSLS